MKGVEIVRSSHMMKATKNSVQNASVEPRANIDKSNALGGAWRVESAHQESFGRCLERGKCPSRELWEVLGEGKVPIERALRGAWRGESAHRESFGRCLERGKCPSRELWEVLGEGKVMLWEVLGEGK